MSDANVLNLLHNLVAVSGVTDTVVSLTSSAVRLADSITLNAGCEIVLLQVEGGNARYRDDGSAPTTSSGFLVPHGSMVFANAGAFGNIRWIASGSDTPTLRVSQRQYVASSVRRAADLSVSMRSVKWRDIVSEILAEQDMEITWLSDAGTTAGQKARLANSFNRNLRLIWEKRFWPALCVTEERDLDDTGAAPLIPYAATGEVNLGLVRAVHTADPRDPAVTSVPVPFTLGASGIQFTSTPDLDAYWVTHQLRVHRFTLAAWDSGTAYSAGAVVYYDTTGECYECIVANTNQAVTNTAYWTIQRAPHFLYDYAVAATLADLLGSRKPESAGYWKQRADNELFRLIQQLGMQSQGEVALLRTA